MLTRCLMWIGRPAWAIALPCASLAANLAAEPQGTTAPTYPFFALCMDTHDTKQRTLEQQAELLKELGYDGAGHLWLDQLPDRIKTLDAAGLKLFQVYVRIDVAPGAKQPYDPRLMKIVPLLKGRDTMLAVLVSGGRPADRSPETRAVVLLREIADAVRDAGVRLALYPHTGDWLERLEDGLRVADKVGRPNVGVMFNLCHWLRVDPSRGYKPLLERALPRLFAVTINGADEFDDKPGWDRYIQPLGRGTFDVYTLLRTLRQLGYRGPVGLQCYGIRGDARDSLSESMKAWRSYLARLEADN